MNALAFSVSIRIVTNSVDSFRHASKSQAVQLVTCFQSPRSGCSTREGMAELPTCSSTHLSNSLTLFSTVLPPKRTKLRSLKKTIN